jgi:hypothetical protein
MQVNKSCTLRSRFRLLPFKTEALLKEASSILTERIECATYHARGLTKVTVSSRIRVIEAHSEISEMQRQGAARPQIQHSRLRLSVAELAFDEAANALIQAIVDTIDVLRSVRTSPSKRGPLISLTPKIKVDARALIRDAEHDIEIVALPDLDKTFEDALAALHQQRASAHNYVLGLQDCMEEVEDLALIQACAQTLLSIEKVIPESSPWSLRDEAKVWAPQVGVHWDWD